MYADLLLNETSPWISMDLENWKPLTQGRKPKLFTKKTFLFHQGDMLEYVYIISSGRVRVTSFSNDGGEKQIYIAEKGAMCGEHACVENTAQSVSAFAIVDSMVYCVPYTEVEEIMRNDWDLTKKILQVICRKNNIFLKQILDLSFTQSLQRVARILLNIGEQYGMTKGTEVHISIKFTHQDVASMINTSRVTTSNIFSLLTERKAISKKNGYFILKDIPMLKQIAIENNLLF